MNLVVLMGNLTRDPELSESSSGKSFCKFSLAVNRDYEEDGVDFFNCTAFSARAEAIAKYFSKGKKILVKGRLKMSDYEDQEGIKRRSYTLMVNHFEFVQSKSSGEREELDEEDSSSSSGTPSASRPTLENSYSPDPNSLPF